jgi:dynein heavy chain
MESVKKTIEGVRLHFKPVAYRVARFFFCLESMSNVDPMYQYSLKWYQTIFERGLQRAEPGNKFERIDAIVKTFTELLYKNVCTSLFEQDKLLFSLLMTMKVMEEKERNEIESGEKRFLMTGGVSVEAPKPNPASHWLQEKTWCWICEMAEKFDCFRGLDIHITENPLDWEAIYNSKQPHLTDEEPFPGPWNNIPYFRRIIILRVLRPDSIIPAF